MDRRAFLTTLSAAVAGAVLDPERLLWVPGRKTIICFRVITLPPASAATITLPPYPLSPALIQAMKDFPAMINRVLNDHETNARIAEQYRQSVLNDPNRCKLDWVFEP